MVFNGNFYNGGLSPIEVVWKDSGYQTDLLFTCIYNKHKVHKGSAEVVLKKIEQKNRDVRLVKKT